MTYSFRYEINNQNPGEKKRFIRNLFDSIVPTYDLLNHMLSLGIDSFWRRRIFKYIPKVKKSWAIDLCCGTGDLSSLLYKHGARLVSLDFSLNMLKKGIQKKSLPGGIIAADACAIPLASETFDVATIAFGIRNIPDIEIFISEVRRILNPGGRFVILELTRPSNMLIKKIYYIYLKKIIPLIGGIAGKFSVYKYLSKTIESFLDPSELERLLIKNGFPHISFHPQTFGIATIIVGQRDIK